MDDFNRNIEDKATYSNVEVLEIPIRFTEKASSKYDNQEVAPPFSFEEIIKELQGEEPKKCYFQNLGKTGRDEYDFYLIVPIKNDNSVTLRIPLYKDERSFKLYQAKRLTYLDYQQIPKNNEEFIDAYCRFNFILEDTYVAYQSPEAFHELVTKASQLPTPQKELNKLKDQKIWENYVKALKTMLKAKERAWEVDKLTSFKKSVSKDSLTLDFSISVKGQISQPAAFEQYIKTEFKRSIRDINISENGGFWELGGYNRIGKKKYAQLITEAKKHFYDLTEDDISFHLSGKITYDDGRKNIFDNLKDDLNYLGVKNYELHPTGELNLCIDNLPQLDKVLGVHKEDVRKLPQIKCIIKYKDKDYGQDILHERVERKIKLFADKAEKFRLIYRSIESSTIYSEDDCFLIRGNVPQFIIKNELLHFEVENVSLNVYPLLNSNKLIPVEGAKIVNGLYRITTSSFNELGKIKGHIFSLYPNTEIRTYPLEYKLVAKQKELSEEDFINGLDQIKSKYKGLYYQNKDAVRIEGKYLVVKWKISPDNIAELMNDYGFNLAFTKATFRVLKIEGDNKSYLDELRKIKGLSIEGNSYTLSTDNSDAIIEYNNKLNIEYPFPKYIVKWYNNEYFFELDKDDLYEIIQKRNEKGLFPLRSKLFGIAKVEDGEITFKTENQEGYFETVEKIKKEVGDSLIINWNELQISNKVIVQINRIGTENTQFQKIFQQIREDVSEPYEDEIEWNYSHNSTKMHFEFSFLEREELTDFKILLENTCSKQGEAIKWDYNNEHGVTRFDLVFNKLKKEEFEKQVNREIRFADFIALNNDENAAYLKEKKQKGLNENFWGGEKIGTLLAKKGNVFKFKYSVKISKNENVDGTVDSFKKKLGNALYVKPTFRGELVQIDRMRKAIDKTLNPTHFNKAINSNLSNFIFDPKEVRFSAIDLNPTTSLIYQNLLSNPIEKFLNDKQKEAVVTALSVNDMALIQGPPGTGKTTVIAEIIWQFISENQKQKVLLTSQTNLAVDNALGRLANKGIIKPIRIGRPDKFEDNGAQYDLNRIEEWKESLPSSQNENESKNNVINRWIERVIKSAKSPAGQYDDIVNNWKQKLGEPTIDLKSEFTDTYLSHVNVYAATCSECESRRFRDAYQLTTKSGTTSFDMVIMDEASKATPPELLLPVTFGKKIIVIGDHKQLPPMINGKDFKEALAEVDALDLIADWEDKDYKISQFEKLFKNAPFDIKATLDTQYRMHKDIMGTINQFYLDELEEGLQCGIENDMDIPNFSNRGSRHHGFELEPFLNPNVHVVWVDVADYEVRLGTSYYNESEVDAVDKVIECITKSGEFNDYYQAVDEEDSEIGVITFYYPQMKKIFDTYYGDLTKKERRNFENNKYKNKFQIPLRINTVDRFQGMERDVIIVSTVRSNKQKTFNTDTNSLSKKTARNINYPWALGFAREHQRINVAFSRAKRLLVIVGNKDHFSKKEEYKKIIDHIKFKGVVINYEQLKDLSTDES